MNHTPTCHRSSHPSLLRRTLASSRGRDAPAYHDRSKRGSGAANRRGTRWILQQIGADTLSRSSQHQTDTEPARLDQQRAERWQNDTTRYIHAFAPSVTSTSIHPLTLKSCQRRLTDSLVFAPPPTVQSCIASARASHPEQSTACRAQWQPWTERRCDRAPACSCKFCSFATA